MQAGIQHFLDLDNMHLDPCRKHIGDTDKRCVKNQHGVRLNSSFTEYSGDTSELARHS